MEDPGGPVSRVRMPELTDHVVTVQIRVAAENQADADLQVAEELGRVLSEDFTLVETPKPVSYLIKNNVTGNPVSQTFTNFESAARLCSEFNSVVVGGMYGVYDTEGNRVWEQP
jgi:hypothetical protein